MVVTTAIQRESCLNYTTFNYKDNSVLWLHHYEETWEEGMLKVAGLSFEEYTDHILDFISRSDIDHVIVTRFEEWLPGDEHYVLSSILDEWEISFEFQTVPYGVVAESFWDKDLPSTIPSKKTLDETDPEIKELIFIDDWMRDLVNAKSVMLAGAFDGECIADAEDILDHIVGEGVYQRIEGLIVGSGVEYILGENLLPGTQRKQRHLENDEELSL